MDDGFIHDIEATLDRRRTWQARREAMEGALSARRRGRGPGVPARFALRRAVRLLRSSRLHGVFGERAVRLGLTRLTLRFADLPPAFDGYRILHLTDLHLDHVDGTAAATARLVSGLTTDLCVVTGDIRDNTRAPVRPVVDRLAHVLARVHPTDGVLGVLGNHDSAAMVGPLEAIGVRMLCNEITHLRRGDDSIHVTGLDDVHRFHTEAAHVTLDEAPDGFGIALVHSPEIAHRAAEKHRLYLTGHTHGGQICLPGGRPLITGLKRHKGYVSGLWRHGGMTGFTCRGVGASVVPLRLNCQGEVALITLRRG